MGITKAIRRIGAALSISGRIRAARLEGYQAAVRETAKAEPRHAGPVHRFQHLAKSRLNRAHWAGAHGQSINSDLATDLATAQAWCQAEYASNPLFEGVCNTFRDDVVGRDGPMLQVLSDDSRFNDAVEGAFRAVFADPDPSHRYGGVEVAKCWVNGLLLAGSYVNILTSVDRSTTPVTFGWRNVHARRLVTPPDRIADQNVAFGCKSDEFGAPIEYYIDVSRNNGPIAQLGTEFRTYRADAVQHVYIPVEGEQLTGFPMMTSTLETAADLRDYDKFVMEAAKNAANHAVGLQSAHPEFVTDPQPIDSDTYRVSAGEVNVAPVGWQWASLTSTQPGAQYVEFRRERASELGRPIHMPLLVVMLSAAEANFSSAQYEGTVYTDGVKGIQGLIERRSMIPFVVNGIVPEVALRGLARVPKSFDLVWTWNVPAHANIEKFVRAIDTMIKLGIIAPSDGSAMVGKDWDKVVAARERCQEQLEDAGLPPTPTDSSSLPPEEAFGEGDAPPEKPAAKTSNPRKRASRARFSLSA